jgi:hypothetical protein
MRIHVPNAVAEYETKPKVRKLALKARVRGSDEVLQHAIGPANRVWGGGHLQRMATVFHGKITAREACDTCKAE